MRKLNTADCFKMFRIIKNANLKEDIESLLETGKTEINIERMGLKVGLVLLEAMGNAKVENEIYSLIASVAETEPDKIKNQPIQETMSMLKEIAKENDLASFFKSATSLTEN